MTRFMTIPHLLAALACGIATAAHAQPVRPADGDSIALGRYLVQTTGCNDCHTAGYGPSNGRIAEKNWLTGDSLGWRGPWGTTYASNLRLYFAGLSEAQWLAQARTMQPRPPMPWFNLREMSDGDLRALYRYVKALGPAGQPAPAYLPPGQVPKPPFVQFPSEPPPSATPAGKQP
jgi:mono/diheme cytochrome c family protein